MADYRRKRFLQPIVEQADTRKCTFTQLRDKMRKDRRNILSDWVNVSQRVMKRDNYRCRCCGASMNLSVHHTIAREDKGGDNIENLITLCRQCHDLAELGQLNLTEINQGGRYEDLENNEVEMYILRSGEFHFLGTRIE